MNESHRLMVDRHEDNRTVVVPRWLLPAAARGDDVFAVTVQADADRAVITLVRDAGATAQAQAEAAAVIERLKRRGPSGAGPR
jgi:hypothetical protein